MVHSFESYCPDPTLLDQWFPEARQKHYIQQVRKQVDITRRRAQCFVRLWAYLLLKHMAMQQGASWSQGLANGTLVELIVMRDEVPCSHREAADVFYANSERGSDRSAGMMIDELAKLKLLSRTFDGNISTIKIRPLANIEHGLAPTYPISLSTDDFNPRVDAVFAAQLLTTHYGWLAATDNSFTAYRINQALRKWSTLYPKGIRVLRQGTPPKLVGIYSLFPTAESANMHFFAPPSNSLYLSTERDDDPVTIAKPGDKNCTAVFIRSWAIETSILSQLSLEQSFLDMRQTLMTMRDDFPNLCDLYALSINPETEAIAQAIGFQKTVQDPDLPLAWLYIPLDQFLELDIRGVIARMDLPT
ncbi:MAG: hypothetical protein AAGD25_20575 [Cyanobacteria bacterium P01_F01_bin.150]